MRVKADFTKNDGDAPLGQVRVSTLELAHGGTNAYGLEFSNLSPILFGQTILLILQTSKYRLGVF